MSPKIDPKQLIDLKQLSEKIEESRKAAKKTAEGFGFIEEKADNWRFDRLKSLLKDLKGDFLSFSSHEKTIAELLKKAAKVEVNIIRHIDDAGQLHPLFKNWQDTIDQILVALGPAMEDLSDIGDKTAQLEVARQHYSKYINHNLAAIEALLSKEEEIGDVLKTALKTFDIKKSDGENIQKAEDVDARVIEALKKFERNNLLRGVEKKIRVARKLCNNILIGLEKVQSGEKKYARRVAKDFRKLSKLHKHIVEKHEEFRQMMEDIEGYGFKVRSKLKQIYNYFGDALLDIEDMARKYQRKLAIKVAHKDKKMDEVSLEQKIPYIEEIKMIKKENERVEEVLAEIVRERDNTLRTLRGFTV